MTNPGPKLADPVKMNEEWQAYAANRKDSLKAHVFTYRGKHLLNIISGGVVWTDEIIAIYPEDSAVRPDVCSLRVMLSNGHVFTVTQYMTAKFGGDAPNAITYPAKRQGRDAVEWLLDIIP